jgi:hypothetical protein
MLPSRTKEVKALAESMGIECWDDKDCVRVSRDSVLAKNQAVHEEDAYSRFLFRLRELTNDPDVRFFYSLKNDEYLWIDEISSK